METPRQPAAMPEQSEPAPAPVSEPDTATRRPAVMTDEAQTIEEPGYGHGV